MAAKTEIFPELVEGLPLFSDRPTDRDSIKVPIFVVGTTDVEEEPSAGPNRDPGRDGRPNHVKPVSTGITRQ